MSYTDSQMIIASQIAYMDFDLVIEDDGPFTVRQLLEIMGESANEETRKKADALLERIETTPGAEACGEWIVRDICNDQHGSGMYACMIDTQDGDAIIAFRGSESDTLENVVKDWVVSDLGLLNSILTPQQMAAQAYTQRLYEKYGDDYECFGLTGHSLGGNLAEHATITAQDEMRDKINRCVNLDGPGYSEMYINAHANDIEKSEDIIEHYQWSWVGSLLTPIPGSHYQTIQAETPSDKSDIENLAWRHDTINVVFSEEGEFVPGKKDILALACDPISKIIDYSIFSIFGAGVAVLWNSLDVLKDTLTSIWNRWQEYRFQDPNTAYEVRISGVINNMEDIETSISRLSSIVEEVEDIRRQIAYNSISAANVKTQLWSVGNKIENDTRKWQTFSRVGKECAECFNNKERIVAEQYI